MKPNPLRQSISTALCAGQFHTIAQLWPRSSVSINQSINQSTNQPNFYSANIPVKPGSVVRQPNQCSTAKSKKQFRNINRPSSLLVSMGEMPSQKRLCLQMFVKGLKHCLWAWPAFFSVCIKDETILSMCVCHGDKTLSTDPHSQTILMVHSSHGCVSGGSTEAFNLLLNFTICYSSQVTEWQYFQLVCNLLRRVANYVNK